MPKAEVGTLLNYWGETNIIFINSLRIWFYSSVNVQKL